MFEKKIVLQVDGISKSFGKKRVLDNLSLMIKEGDRIAITGPNGSGKTTLINILVGLLNQDEGVVIKPSFKTNEEFLKNTGIQFQSESFPKGFKVEEIIDLIAGINFDKKKYDSYRKWWNNVLKPKKKELIEIFGLVKLKKAKVTKLSGGEKQRLNILLALLNDPKIIILDEISTGLDIESQERLLQYIKEYQEKYNATLIIVSHNINEIRELSNTISILDNGRIINTVDIIDLEKNDIEIERFLKEYFVNKKIINLSTSDEVSQKEMVDSYHDELRDEEETGTSSIKDDKQDLIKKNEAIETYHIKDEGLLSDKNFDFYFNEKSHSKSDDPIVNEIEKNPNLIEEEKEPEIDLGALF